MQFRFYCYAEWCSLHGKQSWLACVGYTRHIQRTISQSKLGHLTMFAYHFVYFSCLTNSTVLTKQCVASLGRYFSKQELFELFVLDNPRMSITQLQLQELHGGQETTDSSLDEHFAFLRTLGILDMEYIIHGFTIWLFCKKFTYFGA